MLELWGMMSALSAAEQRGRGQSAVEREEAFYARFREPVWRRLGRRWVSLRQRYAERRNAPVEGEEGAGLSPTAAKRQPPANKRNAAAQDCCCGQARPSSTAAG